MTDEPNPAILLTPPAGMSVAHHIGSSPAGGASCPSCLRPIAERDYPAAAGWGTGCRCYEPPDVRCCDRCVADLFPAAAICRCGCGECASPMKVT